MTFLANPKYAPKVKAHAGRAILVAKLHRGSCAGAADLQESVSRLGPRAGAVLSAAGTAPGIHPLAYVAPTARIGENASIGPFAVVGENVTIGRDAVLYPHVVIYDGATIGDRFLPTPMPWFASFAASEIV